LVFGALRDEPSDEGDQTEIEVSDFSGEPTTEFIEINGEILSKEEAEDLGLKEEENTDSFHCIICNWPINRLLNVRLFYPSILKWIEKSSNDQEKKKEIFKRLEFLKRVKSIPICRYDFFYLIKDIISQVDEMLAEKFEKEVASNYDFSGSLIS